MEHAVDAAVDRKFLGDIGPHELERGTVAMLFEVLDAAGAEVVDRDDFVAARDQRVAQM